MNSRTPASLAPGARLDVYEVTATLGAGGMGEVYRGRDTRLNRDVALKVLPTFFAADADRLARFEREAQTLAALNHPNVAQIYGVVDASPSSGTDTIHALVMELVEGEDLSQRLARGPLPVAEALPIAAQIAAGLEAAHERGIIHRDLKPANVKLAPDGSVKVLDFGLAKANEASAASLEHSPTFTSPALMTQMGVILGTAAYMSPEQARGRSVDKRADLWAFGAVLFEMLTGRSAFAGDTVTDVLASIVTRDPDWTALPPGTPAAIQRLMRRCLTRDPRRRLADAGEARYQIEEALAGTDASTELPSAAPTPRATPRGAARYAPWTIAALALTIAGAAWLARPRDTVEVIRYSIDPPPKAGVNLATRPAIAISPDGRTVAFVATLAGVTRIYLRRQHDFESQPVAGSEGASEPVFSPDGRWLAFFANNRLNKIAIDGGPPESLAAVNDPRGLSWDEADTITYTPESTGGVHEVKANGPGDPVQITKLQGNERTHRWAQALPGNRAVLFTVGDLDNPDNYENATIEAVTRETGERRVVLKGASMARYVAPGYLIFSRGRVLFGTRFNPDRLQVEGTPVALLQGVAGDVTTGASNFATSTTGTLVYFPGATAGGLHRLVWADRKGAIEAVEVPVGSYFDPKLSPDGNRLAVEVAGTSADIWIHDFTRKTFTRLTFGGTNRTPVWSPDGSKVYYVSRDPTGRTTHIMRKAADGSRDAERVASAGQLMFLSNVSDDERSALIYYASARGADIGTVQFQKDAATIVPLIETAFDEYCAALSPDGRWLAYQSDESSRQEIYVRDMKGGGRWQVSTAGGEEPRWSADGRELFFRNDTQLMVAPIHAGGTFQNDPPRLLFDGIHNLRTESGISFDVDSKRNRFLMVRLADTSFANASIRTVTNWSDELARLLPK